jgi:hypothetical protein
VRLEYIAFKYTRSPVDRFSLRPVARLAVYVERHDYVSGNVPTASVRRHQISVAPGGSAWPNCQLQLRRLGRRDHLLSPPGWHHRRWCRAVEAATGPAPGPGSHRGFRPVATRRAGGCIHGGRLRYGPGVRGNGPGRCEPPPTTGMAQPTEPAWAGPGGGRRPAWVLARGYPGCLGGPGRAWSGLVQRPELAGDVVVVAVAEAESDVVADVGFVQAAAAVDQAGSLSVASADFPAGFFQAPRVRPPNSPDPIPQRVPEK